MSEAKEKVGLYLGGGAFVVVVLLFSFVLSALYLSSSKDLGEYYAALSENRHPTIIIDAGHGGEDIGATGVNGRYEKELNFELSMILGEYLRKAGFAVVYTRTEDKLLYTEEQNIKGFRKINDLKNRVAIANSYDDALFISIHMNSFSMPKYSGLQVYYAEAAEGSDVLAETIQSEVRERIQQNNNRKIKKGSDIYILEHAQIPAVLIECGFITNPDECEKLSQKEYQKELSFAILCGIIEYTENK